MPDAKEPNRPSGSTGPATDAYGVPVVDPTKNVLDLVEAAVKRIDDLRDAERMLIQAERRHTRELVDMHAKHTQRMQAKETERIDAIRRVDAEVASRAQAVQAAQAATLAGQVAAAAEAMRTSQAAATQASQEALTRVVTPLQAAIDDLRRAQYEQQGKTSQVIETRDVKSDQRGGSNLAVAVAAGIVGTLSLLIAAGALITVIVR